MLLDLTNQLQNTDATFGSSQTSKGIDLGATKFLFIFIETGTEYDLSFYFTCNLLQVECHPTAFRDAWKLEIQQGKNSIPINQQQLTFAASHYSLAEINTFSWNCISQDQSAQTALAGDLLKCLQSWQHILRSEKHTFARHLNPKVLTETGNLPCDLKSTADFCDVGIQCKRYCLLCDKWILVFPSQIFQGGRQYCKEVCNLCIQIDKDFQLKESELDLYSCIAEKSPVPFSYHFNQRHLAVFLLILDQAVPYWQGKKMRLNLGHNNTIVADKAAGRTSRLLIKFETTCTLSNQASDQDYYIPHSKDHMLTATISKNCCHLRCLLVTAITIAIPLDILLHLLNGSKRKRILASRNHVQNVDSKLLYASAKTLHWISQKGSCQAQQLQPDSFQSSAKVNHIFGPRLIQKFKENDFLGVSVSWSRVGTVLGQQTSHTSQLYSSRSLPSDSLSASNSSNSHSGSPESHTALGGFGKKNGKKGKHYVKSSNSIPLIVVNKGPPGFNLAGSSIAETLVVASGPILACKFLNAPMSSATGFNCNCEHNVDVSTVEMSSLASLSLPATEQELYTAPNSELITGHYLSSDDTFRLSSTFQVRGESGTKNLLSDEEENDTFSSVGTFVPSRHSLTSNPQIEMSTNLQCGNDNRNCGQSLGCLKESPNTATHRSDSMNKIIVNCSDQLSIPNDQPQLEQSMHTKSTSCSCQNGSNDRNTQGSVNKRSNNKSGIIAKGKDESGSYHLVSGTGSASTNLTKESNKVYCGSGDGSGANCGEGRDSQHNDKVEKANDVKLVDNHERVNHSTLVGGSGEPQVNSYQSRRRNCILENHVVKGKKGAGNTTVSESSSSGSSHSFAHMNNYGTVGKGNNYCIWQKVQKNLRDDSANEPKTIDCVRLQSGKDLQSGPQTKSLISVLPATPKNSWECSTVGHNFKKQCFKEPEDHNEHGRLHGQIAPNDVSSKFPVRVEPPGSQLIGKEALIPSLPLQAKARHDGGKVHAHVTKTRKGIWTRKMGSSQDNGKLFSQKGDIDVSQQSTHSETLNTDGRNLQHPSRSKTQVSPQSEEPKSSSSHSTPHGADTIQSSRGVFSLTRSSAQIQSSLNQTLPFLGTSKSIDHATMQTRQQASHMKSSGQLGEARLWKERTIINAEKGVSRERNNERYRTSQQVIQKWIPVESKSAGVGKASSTDKVGEDNQGNRFSCRMTKEGRQNEDESPDRCLASSPDPRDTDVSTKPSIHKGAVKIGQSSAQVEILGSPLTIPQKRVMGNTVHAEHGISNAGCVSDDFCKPFFTLANDASSSDMESNKMVQTVLKAIDASYEYQMESEFIARAIGSPLSEFEKVLDAVSPVIGPVSDKQHCKSYRNLWTKRLICSCQVANIPLKNIWQWYEEHGNYGLEVKAQDLQHLARPGIDGDLFRAYFVPFLSGMQLFGSSLTSQARSCTGVQNSVQQEANTEFGNLPVLSPLVPKPTIEDDLGAPECLGLGSDLCSCDGNHSCRCNNFMDNFCLLFEFFECEQPHQRKPMFDKIRELTGSDAGSSSQLFGDPGILNSIKIGNLHPASWFAVAWYPIYRIPEGHLRAAFLTYHSLGRFSYRSASSNSLGGSDHSLIAPVVGLQSYSSQAECWFEPKKCHESFPVERIPSNPSEVLRERLRTLEEAATSMTRGLTRKGPNSHMNKHSDYEFFLRRRR